MCEQQEAELKAVRKEKSDFEEMCEQQRLEAIIEKKQLLKKIEELERLVSLVKGKHVRA